MNFIAYFSIRTVWNLPIPKKYLFSKRAEFLTIWATISFKITPLYAVSHVNFCIKFQNPTSLQHQWQEKYIFRALPSKLGSNKIRLKEHPPISKKCCDKGFVILQGARVFFLQYVTLIRMYSNLHFTIRKTNLRKYKNKTMNNLGEESCAWISFTYNLNTRHVFHRRTLRPVVSSTLQPWGARKLMGNTNKQVKEFLLCEITLLHCKHSQYPAALIYKRETVMSTTAGWLLWGRHKVASADKKNLWKIKYRI
jgi:hypothetical protein